MARNALFQQLLCGIAVLLAGVLACGGVSAAGLSCTGLPAVVGDVTSKPVSCTVNCSAGGTLASAIALKPQTTNRLTITIKGICVESNDDLPGGITLQGASSSAKLQAPKSATDPVLGISGTGVNINDLTISGGVYALRGHGGSAFTGTDLVIEGASSADVLLNHGSATLNTSTIENSGGDGIEVQWGGAVFLNGGIVRNNTATGVNAIYDGNADVYGGAVLQNNGVQGAGGGYGGALLISAGTVTKNGFGSGGSEGIGSGTGGHLVVEGSSTSISGNDHNGLLVDDGGTALVQDDAKIENNSGNGLIITQGGFAKVRSGASVTGNTANGIYVETGTVTVGDTGGAAVTIQNNKGNGVLVRTNSLANFDNAGNQITTNADWGVFCLGTSSNPLIYEPLGTAGTVSGNGAGQVSSTCKIAP